MSYDKSVWTSEPLGGDGPAWYWGLDDVVDRPAPYPREVLTAQAFTDEHFPAFVRSVHAIPSAEEIAALVELAEACAHADRDARMLRSEYLWRSRISAALARLDAVRKGRGA